MCRISYTHSGVTCWHESYAVPLYYTMTHRYAVLYFTWISSDALQSMSVQFYAL